MLNCNHKSRSEKGSVLVFTLLILGSIMTIALTMTAIFLPKLKALTDAGSSVGAIYAADSELEWCIYISRGNTAINPPTMDNGATYTISPGDCTVKPLDQQVVGTYHGVSRSLQVTTP